MANLWFASHRGVWAVVPVKETVHAKQRLSDVLSPRLRQELALAMFEDVMQALAAVSEFSGIAVVTCDQNATEIASRLGAEVWTEGAREGHTGAVTAAARRLNQNSCTMLAIPGDVPLVTPTDLAEVVNAHPSAPAFTIVPASDERGSDTIMCSPPDVVPLRFGANSFWPHLAAARACGVTSVVVRNHAIGLDIDQPADLAEFMKIRSRTRSWELLDQHRAKWESCLVLS